MILNSVINSVLNSTGSSSTPGYGPTPAPGFLKWDASTATGSPVLSNEDTSFLGVLVNAGTLASNLAGGKYYAEVLVGGDGANSAIGLAVRGSGWEADEYVGRTADGWGWIASTGLVENNRATVATLPAYFKGDVVRIALDSAAGNCWLTTTILWLDSTGVGTGTPSAGINPTLTGLTSISLSPAASTQDAGATVCTIRKPADWTFGAPAGFVPFPPA